MSNACVWVDSAYQEMERERFAALESKARSDKNVMMSRLLHAAYVGVSESLRDAMVESPVGSLVQPTPLLPGLTLTMLLCLRSIASSVVCCRMPVQYWLIALIYSM